MARLLGLEVTKVNRLLRTLGAIGLAEQDERRKYRPGPGIHVLAAQSLFGSGLIQRSVTPLESLYHFGHVVALGVLWRDQTAYLFHGRPNRSTVDNLGHTQLYSATSSGLGLVLLAQRSEADVRDLYCPHRQVARPPSAPECMMPDLDGEDGLLKRLDRIRADGWALQPIPGTTHRTVAIALNNHTGAAIGMSGDFTNPDVPELLGALRDVAHMITTKETL